VVIEEASIKAWIMAASAPPSRPAEIPFAVDVKVTQRFRASLQHPFSVLCNFTCPVCDKHEESREFFIAENGGTTATACQCGSNLRVKLEWNPAMP
jgi:hypothetical protein